MPESSVIRTCKNGLHPLEMQAGAVWSQPAAMIYAASTVIRLA